MTLRDSTTKDGSKGVGVGLDDGLLRSVAHKVAGEGFGGAVEAKTEGLLLDVSGDLVEALPGEELDEQGREGWEHGEIDVGGADVQAGGGSVECFCEQRLAERAELLERDWRGV